MRRPLPGRLSGRRMRLWTLAALCVGAILAIGASTASAATSVTCDPITGSGSSLQSIMVKEVYITNWESTGWKSIFGKGTEESVCSASTTVTYTPTSSGKGLAEWGAATGKIELKEAGNGEEKLDSFVGTDVGPEGPSTTAGTQIANMDLAGENTSTKEKNSVVAIPIGKSAISVIVTLPVGCTLKTAGTQPAVAKNTSLAEEWNEAKVHFSTLFSNVNSISNCEVNPSGLQARETASGTTAGFKRYLNAVTPVAKTYETFTNNAVKSESASEWPDLATKTRTGNTTGGVLAEKVIKKAGLIGYADLSDAIKAGFTTKPEEHTEGSEKYIEFIAKVPNGGETETKGEAVSPEGEEESSNCEKSTFTEPAEIGENVDWSKATESNNITGEKGVYPICTLTFDVLWGHPEFLSATYGANFPSFLHTLHSIFEWLLNNLSSLQSSIHSHHFDVFETGKILEGLFLVIFKKV